MAYFWGRIILYISLHTDRVTSCRIFYSCSILRRSQLRI